MNEQFPEREQNAESREQNPESSDRSDIEHDDGKKETQKSLDALQADVQIDQEGHVVEKEKRDETIDTKKKIDELHTDVEQRGKSKEQNVVPSETINYESMTEEQITAQANKGRETSVNNVSQMIEQTSFVPKWLKRLVN